MARKQYETKFISELKRSVFYTYPDSSFWYKLPDDFKFKKPFDIICAMYGKHFAIEAKVHTKHTAWPISDIKEHQIEGLKKAAKGGYKSFVLLRIVYGKGLQRLDFVAVITLENIDEWIRAGKKSISVADLRTKPHLIREKHPDCDNFMWNVWSLL